MPPYSYGTPNLTVTSGVYLARYPMEPLTSGTIKTAVYWSLFPPRLPGQDKWRIAWIFLSTDVDGSHNSNVILRWYNPAVVLPPPPIEDWPYTYDPTNGTVNGVWSVKQ